MHELAKILRQRVAEGLQRNAITLPSQWATRYRVMGPPFPGPMSFSHHPWAKEPQDSCAQMQVAQKAAQMGFTEIGLNKAFKAIDIDGFNVLYILPALHPDARDFSTSRFDAALELSPHLANLFTDVKNVGHKRAGSANLFIRGSRSRTGLKSIPANLIVFDELDEMVQENIVLAYERQSGQTTAQSQIYKVSTPTIENFGINKFFKQSSQCHYIFRCPHCLRQTELDFLECLKIIGDSKDDPRIKESHLICKECKHKLDHETKMEWLGASNAHWVPTVDNREVEGWYINQLYSIVRPPYKIAELYFGAQVDPSDEQEYYNSKGGLPHVVKGGRITDDVLKECLGNYTTATKSDGAKFVTMGIDVGIHLHIEVDEWTFNFGVHSTDISLLVKCRQLAAIKAKEFSELDEIMRSFKVRFCVIDIDPETRSSLDFARRFHGIVRMCRYTRGVEGKVIKDNPEDMTVHVNRTAWLDLSLGRFHKKTLTLPSDTSLEYKMHLKALARIYDKDADGNPIGRYEAGDVADHFAHARNYAEIALALGYRLTKNQSIHGGV